jgi:hypothetical protein
VIAIFSNILNVFDLKYHFPGAVSAVGDANCSSGFSGTDTSNTPLIRISQRVRRSILNFRTNTHHSMMETIEARFGETEKLPGPVVRFEKEGPTTTSEPARAEGVKPQSMGTAIGALEGMDLVERKAQSHRWSADEHQAHR